MPQSGSLAQGTIRALYVYPSDVPDRFVSVANAIVSDGAAIDGWWRAQDPTHEPQWDFYAFPGCGGGFASLDLGALQLAHDRAYYTAASGFERVLSEVAPHLGATEKALVFFDGFVVDERICGISEEAPRNGGEYGLSIVSLQSGCWVDLGAGAGTARIAAHELVHNLGAVSSSAPNRCGDAGGHVCDSPNDLMFPYASEGMRLDGTILDVGRDDYYGHSGKWWDVQDSAWLIVAKPVIGTPTSVPATAIAGRRFTVSFDVKRSDTGTPLTGGKLICDPSVAGKVLRHAESFKDGTASLSFVIPKSARGRLLKVRLTIAFGDQAAAKLTTFRIH